MRSVNDENGMNGVEAGPSVAVPGVPGDALMAEPGRRPLRELMDDRLLDALLERSRDQDRAMPAEPGFPAGELSSQGLLTLHPTRDSAANRLSPKERQRPPSYPPAAPAGPNAIPGRSSGRPATEDRSPIGHATSSGDVSLAAHDGTP
jgi:hypothetical protein